MGRKFKRQNCGGGIWVQRFSVPNTLTRAWVLGRGDTNCINVINTQSGITAQIYDQAGIVVEAQVELERFEEVLRQTLDRYNFLHGTSFHRSDDVYINLESGNNKIICGVTGNGTYIKDITEFLAQRQASRKPGKLDLAGETGKRLINEYSVDETIGILAAIKCVRDDSLRWQGIDEPVRADLVDVEPVVF